MARKAQFARGKACKLTPDQYDREVKKQDRRRAAAELAGDAWSGLNSRMETPSAVNREVKLAMDKYHARKREEKAVIG